MIYTATSCISPSTELVVALIEGFVLQHIIGLDGSTEPGGTGLHPPTHTDHTPYTYTHCILPLTKFMLEGHRSCNDDDII